MDKLSNTLPEEPVKESDAEATQEPAAPPPKKDPTRYGDWEKNGRCIDF
ncbi:DUF1674 domain-containing protein [Candidatus Paracaedibacter symbiosus]|nr:DUF1674 domain-containing protein [Candidatus Paracaedibacter symbiosus]